MTTIETTYPNITSFKDDLSKVGWANFIREASRKTNVGKPNKWSRYFAIYQNARKSIFRNPPIMILGREDARENYELMGNMGVLALKNEFQCNRKKIQTVTQLKNADVKKHVMHGAILNQSNWFIGLNDIVMVGVIDARKQLHILQKKEGKISKKDLWSKKDNRPTVLGREIFMAAYMGYKRVECSDVLGNVLVPPKKIDVKENQYSKHYERLKGISQNNFFKVVEPVRSFSKKVDYFQC